MKHSISYSRSPHWPRILILSLGLALASCRTAHQFNVQGYAEGDFVYVASPSGGALEKLDVERGANVVRGADLFSLDDTPEKATLAEAQARLLQAQSQLEDQKKGSRPTELAELNAELLQTQANLDFAEKDFQRNSRLQKTKAVSEKTLQESLAKRDAASQLVQQWKSRIQTAQLGARSDAIQAAEQNVFALEAAVAKAKWSLHQKHQRAPHDALVFDTLYRRGEWVGAGMPVVVLLPPENIKVRTFVSEREVGNLHLGDPVHVSFDGCDEPIVGHIHFISPQAEYTPPMIYSEKSRDKLVFLVELHIDPQDAPKLHPGQPVDVHFGA